MQILVTIVRGALVVLFVAGAALSLGCEDEQEENANCESKAVAQYVADLPECDQQLTDCMNDCSDTDLDECLRDCEDGGFSCYANYNFSLAGCSCLKKSTECIFQCKDFDDFGCLMDCSSVYVDCAGTDSPSVCAMTCESVNLFCDQECQDDSTDVENYLQCRAECSSTLSDCLPDCT